MPQVPEMGAEQVAPQEHPRQVARPRSRVRKEDTCLSLTTASRVSRTANGATTAGATTTNRKARSLWITKLVVSDQSGNLERLT